MKVLITEEMRKHAKIESNRRDYYIKHHFEVDHLSYSERDELGFLGEFACCSLLNIDWKKNIREDYLSIDDYDFKIKGLKADVKTETVPLKYATKILKKTISDNELYGRRLINKGQFNLLTKYDIVIFGLFIREQLNTWYPLGYIETKQIIQKYPPIKKKPSGGIYPFTASPVPTSILRPVSDLV